MSVKVSLGESSAAGSSVLVSLVLGLTAFSDTTLSTLKSSFLDLLTCAFTESEELSVSLLFVTMRSFCGELTSVSDLICFCGDNLFGIMIF